MNISSIHDCFGCGVCATVCSKGIIKIELNADGFYEPYIRDVDKCTDCGLCVEVCSFSHINLAVSNKAKECYAAWSNDFAVRRKCSSGGVGFEIGRALISDGYNICGVKYNIENNRAEHYISSTIEELIPSIGSKYIQSYTVDAFKTIDRRKKYLVTGTPCQIDSFRRYLQKFKREDNFILLDFFCHSVPSMLMWNKYVKLAEEKVGKLTYVSWRNKITGWHDSYAMAIGGNKNGEKNILNSRLSKNDIFYKLFLGDYCCNPACIKNCKFKYDSSSADIRIGDFWGDTYNSNEDGVSAVIAFSQKGGDVLKRSNCTFVEHSFETVAEGQMKSNAGKAYLSFIVRRLIKSSVSYPLYVYKCVFELEKMLKLPKRVLRKIKKLMRRWIH